MTAYQVKDNTFISDIQGKEGKEGYVNLLFAHLSRMSFSLNNTELGILHANIYYNALLIINHIPNKKVRDELKIKLKENIETYTKAGKEESAALITAAIDIVGDVMDHIDEMLGIERNSKIAISLACSDCEYRKQVLDAEEIKLKEMEQTTEVFQE